MKSYTHFTYDERESLLEKLKEGKNQSQIARELGRNRSTISREIKRNWSKTAHRYHPWRATVLYICRRRRCVRRSRLTDEELRDFVIKGLKKYWSPEIISARWKMEHPESSIAPATIYRSIRKNELSGITPKKNLRRRGKKKNAHGYRIRSAHSIHDRPSEVEKRQRLWDLEGDTVYGGVGQGCLVTLVDRTSRVLYAALSKSRERHVILNAFGKALGDLEPRSITLDNGSEFADFPQIEKNHNTTVYFADPHSPWQRASNENMNGLLRFFFPKGTNFLAVTQEELDNVIDKINNRPRKCLGWLSPLEFLAKMCCS